MTRTWLPQTPNPPRIPEFYTLTKIHKPTLVGRPIVSGCDGPTERLSSFVDTLLQPISKARASYLKDTTDFINFIENTKVKKRTFLVSMDVTRLYTNIPHEESIATKLTTSAAAIFTSFTFTKSKLVKDWHEWSSSPHALHDSARAVADFCARVISRGYP